MSEPNPSPKFKNKKTIIGVLIGIILVGSVLLIERSVRLSRGIPDNADGQSLPLQSKLQNLASKEVITFEKLKGKVLLINFWASWCDACMAEMPSINQLYNKLKPEGFEVVSINVDDNPASVAPPIVKELNLQFPIYIDNSGVLSQTFDVVAIPFSIVTDRDLNVIWTESGERDWSADLVVDRIRELLRKAEK